MQHDRRDPGIGKAPLSRGCVATTISANPGFG